MDKEEDGSGGSDGEDGVVTVMVTVTVRGWW